MNKTIMAPGWCLVICLVYAPPIRAQPTADPSTSDESASQSTTQTNVGDATNDIRALRPRAQPRVESPLAVEAAEPIPEPGIDPRLPSTGSRISSASPGPITVVSRQDLLASGKTTIAEVLQRLPIQTGGINIQTNAGGTGASRLNLRGLGSNRTLVLLNGRRFVAGGDGVDTSVDLNSIPLQIVDHIEILKQSASAIYGSAAASGVVNIITRRGFSGVEAGAYVNLSERNDARIYQVDATTGVASDRGSFLFSAMFLDQQPIFATERDFSDSPQTFDFTAYDNAGRPDDFEPFIDPFGGNSSAPPQGNIIDRRNELGNPAWQATGCAGGTCTNDPDDGWTPGLQTYNFVPGRLLLTPSRRLSLYSEGHYEVSDYLDFYFEANFTNRVSKQQRSTPVLFTVTEGITVSAENRFNPFGRNFIDVRRRFVELGNQAFEQDSNTFRAVVGARGDLPLKDWQWDVYGNFGRTETTNTLANRINRTRLVQALGPDSECTGACVPLDIFSGEGGITQEMLDFISFTGIARGFSEQSIVAANAAGPLFALIADQPVTLSVGYQFRKEVGGDIPDPIVAGGQDGGGTVDSVEGRFEMHAAHAELWIPLLRNLPGLDRLDLHAGARLARFDTFGNSFTGQLGLHWHPIKAIGLRGSFATAFRAPSIRELSTASGDFFTTASDPCSIVAGVGRIDDPIVAANCALDELANGVADTSTTLRTQVGGNPDLAEETVRTINLGIVLEDALVEGLTASIDYFNVEINDVAETVGAQFILSGCFENVDRRFCDQVVRGNDGLIDFIDDRLTNAGGLRTSGVDFEVRYRTPQTGIGQFDIGLDGTIVTELVRTTANGLELSFKGNNDGSFANPDYRLNSYVRWAADIWRAGLNFRFIPGIVECGVGGSTVPCDDARPAGATPPIERPVDDYVYLDVFAGIDVQTLFGHTMLTLGINNVTDATPPFIAGGFIAETDDRLYDFVGRQFYARLIQAF